MNPQAQIRDGESVSGDHEQSDRQIRHPQPPTRSGDNPPSALRPPPSESQQSAIRVLRRFVRPRTAAAVERCELCSAELAHDHEHLFEPPTRQLLCACQPCAILFSGQTGTKYRRVPRRVRFLPDFRLTDAQWES
ncbi:MAG: DUF5947 family protein, partial [Pyrinomonadaceae bacterium]